MSGNRSTFSKEFEAKSCFRNFGPILTFSIKKVRPLMKLMNWITIYCKPKTTIFTPHHEKNILIC